MFCGECGTQNPDTNQFCKNCGKPLNKRQPQAVPVQPVLSYQPVTPSYIPPVNAAKPQVSPPAAHLGYAVIPIASATEKLLTIAGIVGFLVSIASLVIYPYLCGIIAIVLGTVVLYKSGNRKRKGVIIAVLGLIIGFGSIIVELFYFTIFPPQVVHLMFFWLIQ